MDKTELLCCPFCGTTEHLSVRPEGSYTPDMPARPYRVVCHFLDHDTVEGPIGYGTNEAIAAWNRRATPSVEADRLRETPLSVRLENGQLVISIGLDILANAVMFNPSLSHFDDNVSDDVLEPTITDADKFFNEVVQALESEEEDGTTPVHRMLDAAALSAIENGAEGIETGWDKADKLRAALASNTGGSDAG